MACAAAYTSDCPLAATPLLIVDEITHRVLNDYTYAIATLSIAATEAVDDISRSALKAVMERMLAFADVHRALRAPGGSGVYDLGEYLQTLCAAMTSGSLSDRRVHLTLIQSEIPMTAQRCWQIGLIVSELITNAARHAFGKEGGQVLVDVHASRGKTYCRVSDNGRAVSSGRCPGRGTRIIESLAHELDGEVEWTFGPNGTTAILTVPCATAASAQA